MADGHFADVELLRRELAILILEWAGKAVKDDPESPMSTALTRAVSEAARGAVTDQHQILTAEAADRIAEAFERRGRTGGLFASPRSALLLGLGLIVAVALLTTAYLLGLQAGRKEGALPVAVNTTATDGAPIAPLAPVADELTPSSALPRDAAPQPAARPERIERGPAKPASRPAPRELGRPAPTSDEAAPRSTQPVGAAATAPASLTPGTTP